MKLLVTLAFTTLTLFANSAFGQATATQTAIRQTEAVPEQPKPGKQENKAAAAADDVADLKAENAAIRELLRKMEEQQKTLLEQVDKLQRRLDGSVTADVQPAGQTPVPPVQTDTRTPTTNTANVPGQPTNASKTSSRSTTVPAKQLNDNRYRDGIVIWETGEDAKIPFMLKFNNNTQFRYLNTLSSNDTFTDHLGIVREVHKRNDLTVNRSMFILGGYVFDKRLRYSLTVWTSAGAASIVVAGNIGWQFNKALTVTAGYTGVPGSRSLVNTFPFFTSTDRSMADNFFRPGFTQGVWANGEPVKNLHYLAFVGNGLNTLSISANKIDPQLVLSGSVWWEPLGPYGEPGKSRNMYEDYFESKKTRVRFGTAFTRSREDRFSNLDQSSPENTSLYNSDGVLSFSTGAFAPGLTLDKATYKMWAIDGGVKWNGLAVNGQYFMRWLGDFQADGPLPLASTFDHGYELSAGQFVIPKKLMVYGRGSQVFGQFRNSWEYGAGVKWHFLPTERLWINTELMRVNHAPYSGAFTPYTAGMNGWMPMVQAVLAF
ncbi:MAG TPA: hypothetical protein VGC97_15990 [Pyrinomonadaceae bacterium]